MRIFLAIALLYFSAIGFIYLFQRKIIFQGTRLARDYRFSFTATEHFIPTPDGEQINALLFQAKRESKGLILYFHGNADNLKRWGEYAIDFTTLGFDVLMIDYRSFGKSSGKAAENTFYADATTVYDWIHSQLPQKYDKFVIYGRSLGAAVATSLASKVNADLVILETPFNSFRGAISKALRPLIFPFPFKNRFNNTERLPNIKSKIVIFQGTRDRIVPLSAAKQLKPLLKKGDEFIIIPKGKHKNLRTFEQFHTKLKEVLSNL